jgi:hypothetical protein
VGGWGGERGKDAGCYIHNNSFAIALLLCPVSISPVAGSISSHTEVVLANGMRVVYKHTHFLDDVVQFKAFAYGGLSELDSKEKEPLLCSQESQVCVVDWRWLGGACVLGAGASIRGVQLRRQAVSS